MKNFVVIISLTLLKLSSFAQCAMCKASAEQSLEHGATVAKGLNTGILYMMTFPLIGIGIVCFIIWKHWRAEGDF